MNQHVLKPVEQDILGTKIQNNSPQNITYENIAINTHILRITVIIIFWSEFRTPFAS